MINVPVWEKANRTLEEAAAYFGVGINKLREISCTGHAARQLTRGDYDAFDLLIGMDGANLRNMHRICGGDPEGKLSLLMDHTNRPGDVADPWYTGDFDATWQDVLEGCRELLKEIPCAGMDA